MQSGFVFELCLLQGPTHKGQGGDSARERRKHQVHKTARLTLGCDAQCTQPGQLLQHSVCRDTAGVHDYTLDGRGELWKNPPGIGGPGRPEAAAGRPLQRSRRCAPRLQTAQTDMFSRGEYCMSAQ